MNSPFANIFLAIQQRIQDEVPSIVYSDQDLGQLSCNQPSVSFPCVLVDFEDFTFENLGEQVQTAKGTVVLRLGFTTYCNSSQGTPEDVKEQALAYYDLEWALHKAIQDWSPADDLGYMVRKSAGTSRNNNIRIRDIRYSISFEDYSTKAQQQYVNVPVVVSEVVV